MEKFFKLGLRGTDKKTEIIAGLTTFMTMAYVLAVQPAAICGGEAYITDVNGVVITKSAIMITCALVSGLITLLMAFYTNFPFALSTGMGSNFILGALIQSQALSFGAAMVITLISGIVFVLLTVFGLRDLIVRVIPKNIKIAISASIGFFIAYLGFQNCGIGSFENGIALGNLADPAVLLAIGGLLLIIVLNALHVKGAILISIIATTLIGIPLGVTTLNGVAAMPDFGDLGNVMFNLDFKGVFTASGLILVFVCFFGDFFSTLGTVLAVANRANMLDEHGNLPGIERPFLVDAKRYQLLLIKKAVGAQRFTSMANSFNHSSLKKRIAMMLKQKSSPWARLKYLYVLPLAALTVVAFARPEISHELEKISSVKISEIIPVQEKKEPKRNVEVETLARDSVVSEKDMQAIQEKVSAVMEKYQPEIDKAVEEAVKAANIDEIVSAEMAKHQVEIDKAVQAAIEAAKINETIAAEMEKIQPEINRAIEEAMKAIDINEKAVKEASKVKSSFSGIVYIDGVESSKERMDNLNPDHIASMNVYKGNEAIAKFGEKGRNGVIEIKLKK